MFYFDFGLSIMDHFSLCRACIQYLQAHPQPQVNLKHLSDRFGMEETQLQKVFTRYVGISPKQFQTSLIVNQSQSTLKQASVLQTSLDLDLTSPARLHDAYVTVTAMSPGEFKSKGRDLTFYYCREYSIFGDMVAISTDRGLFYLGFHDQFFDPVETLLAPYPNAQKQLLEDGAILGYDPVITAKPLHAHIAASNFQLQVWQALLTIPPKTLTHYQSLANELGKPKGARAVGQAVGKNPIAYLIPCHRVIKQSGALSGYRWGTDLKQALIAKELADV